MNNKNIIENLENLINLEELLQIEKQNYEELKEKNDKINMAKMLIEKAYEKMKNSVTPKFTSNLSENIFEISDGKYKKVTINDDEGIIVELPNGKYVSAEKLSGGTIEQLYLSLRLSMAKEISYAHPAPGIWCALNATTTLSPFEFVNDPVIPSP